MMSDAGYMGNFSRASTVRAMGHVRRYGAPTQPGPTAPPAVFAVIYRKLSADYRAFPAEILGSCLSEAEKNSENRRPSDGSRKIDPSNSSNLNSSAQRNYHLSHNLSIDK